LLRKRGSSTTAFDDVWEKAMLRDIAKSFTAMAVDLSKFKGETTN